MLKKRVLSIFIALVLLVGMLPSSLISSFAAPSSASFVSGTLDSEWTIVNPATAGDYAYELVKGSGLKLKTQPSGMQQGTNGDGDVSNPVNVFTRPADGNAWEAVAKVYYPKAPTHNYQQFAFGVYQDANNYLKVDIEYNSWYGGRIAQFSINRNGTYTHTHRTRLNYDNPAFTNNSANRIDDLVAYYKIVKSGNTYTASVSFDGIEYITVGTGTTNTNGQYTAEYAAPKLFVAAINDTTASSILDTYCEFVKVYNIDGGASLDVLSSALSDVVNYAKAEAGDFNAVPAAMNLAAGTRANTLLFSQFPKVPYGYSYQLVPGDADLLVASKEGVVSAQKPGSTTLALQLINGASVQTLKTIDVTIAAGTAPVTVIFDYNYEGAPAAPASFTKQTVGGKLESFPVEQTLPDVGSRPNYGFVGWYRNADGTGEKVTLDTVFTADTNLFAKWEEVPSLHEAYEDYFLMGAFQDYSYNANPAVGSAQYIYNKHYNIMCPSNNFKLTNMISTTTMRNNFTAARTSILANNALSDDEKLEQIARANEQIVLNPSPTVTTQLNALRNWNIANPDNKKYTRFHVIAWHGGQQPNAFFGNGFTGGTTLTLKDEPWDSTQDGAVASRETMKARLDNYIRLVMERYKDYTDVIISWDVINEPVDDFTGQIRNASDSNSQVGQWGRVWHDMNPAKLDDGTLKYTTAANAMGIIVNPERLYDESEWMRWAFESSVKWTKANGLNWALYVNDYMDSNKLYTKLQPTLDILQSIRNDIELQGVPLVYGFQGRLAWGYPTIDMLRKQADDALAIADMIGVTEADIRSDFEPNPYFNPFQRTKLFASGDTPAWANNSPDTSGSGSTTTGPGQANNTFDTHNSPVRRIPEWGTTNGMTSSSVRYGATDHLPISEQIMKKQADFAADWMDILIERADKVELFQWDNYTDSSTFNASKGAHIWVNSGVGRTGTFEKYSFFAVIGAPARDKLKTAINAFPPAYMEDLPDEQAAVIAKAKACLNKRIYTLEDVNDVKALTATLTSMLSAINISYITYDANGGDGVGTSESFPKGFETVTKAPAAVGISKPGFAFVGWNTSANGIGAAYDAGAAITMNISVRLYAQWKKAPAQFTVAFDSFTNGTGSSLVDAAYPPVTVAVGQPVAEPAVRPAKVGYRFEGWFRDMATTKPWNFSTPVTENMRLYAGYSIIPPPKAASIKVDGIDIPGFDPSILTYTLTYDAVQTPAPVVTATAEDGMKLEGIAQAPAIPGIATVTLSGNDQISVYAIRFVLSTPKLASITVDGLPLEGFSADQLNYKINFEPGQTIIPSIAAVAVLPARDTVSYEVATAIPGKTLITVFNEFESVTYTVAFSVGPISDSFVGGALDKFWEILAPNPDTFSLVKGLGLNISTLQGDIYQTNKSFNNVFIREADGNWEVVAKVHFPVAPNSTYQQFMLLGWKDDDNYVKLDVEASSATARVIQFMREQNGATTTIGTNATATNFNNADGSLTLYFRLRKNGDSFTAAYSRNGTTWTNQPTAGTATTLAGVTHVGLFATRNTAGAAIDAFCEYVKFTQIDGETVVTYPQMRQEAVDNVRNYIAADIPAVFEEDGQITFSQMPRGYTAAITNSENPAIISVDGVVTCPDAGDVIVPITVTITDASSIVVTPGSEYTATTTLDILVKGKAPAFPIELTSPISKIVAGYAANIPVDIEFDSSMLEAFPSVTLIAPDGEILSSFIVSGSGQYVFNLAADKAVAGTYKVAILGASLSIECSPIPEKLWAPSISAIDGLTNLAFDADVTLISKASVKIAAQLVDMNKVSVAGSIVTINQTTQSGQSVVISGVKFADLFPSYSFTFSFVS